MNSATYTGEMLSADFQENTITFEIEGDFKVKAGTYYIFSVDDLQNLADKLCEKQRESCAEIYRKIEGDNYEPSIYEAIRGETFRQPKIDEL